MIHEPSPVFAEVEKALFAEVEKAPKSLKNNKSPGYDGIPAKLLKILGENAKKQCINFTS